MSTVHSVVVSGHREMGLCCGAGQNIEYAVRQCDTGLLFWPSDFTSDLLVCHVQTVIGAILALQVLEPLKKAILELHYNAKLTNLSVIKHFTSLCQILGFPRMHALQARTIHLLAAVHVQMGTPQSLAEIGEIKLRACGIFQTNQLDI